MINIKSILFVFATLFFAGNAFGQTVDISKLNKISTFTGDVVAEFEGVEHVAGEIWKARSGDKDVAITVTPGTPVKLAISGDEPIKVTYTPNPESETAIGELADGTQVFVSFEGSAAAPNSASAPALSNEELAALPSANEVAMPILQKCIVRVHGKRVNDQVNPKANKRRTMYLEGSYFRGDSLYIIGSFNITGVEAFAIKTAIDLFAGGLPTLVTGGLYLGGYAIQQADYGVMFYLTPAQLELIEGASMVEIFTKTGGGGIVHKMEVDGDTYTLQEGGVLYKDEDKD